MKRAHKHEIKDGINREQIQTTDPTNNGSFLASITFVIVDPPRHGSSWKQIIIVLISIDHMIE